MKKPRSFTFEARFQERDGEHVDLEARTAPMVLATAAPITSSFGVPLVLSHAKGARKLRHPASAGTPLLVGHDRSQPPVARIRAIRTEGDITLGLAHFGSSSRADELLRDIADGVITDVSVGADLTDIDDSGPEWIARRWTLDHAALVGVGADPDSTIRRDDMPDKTPDVVDLDQVRRELRTQLATDVSELRALYADTGLLEQEVSAIERVTSGTTDLEKERATLLAALKADRTVVVGPGRTSGLEDEVDKFARAAELNLEVRTGTHLIGYHDGAKIDAKARDREARQSEFQGLSLLELGRECLKRSGVPHVDRMSRDQVISRMLTRAPDPIISHSTADFSSLTAATVNKALAGAYEEAPETWRAWAQPGTLPDFKAGTRPMLSTFGDLNEVVGDAEYTYGTMSDKHEPIQLLTYGRLFSISRRAIINDDTMAFSQIPAAIGRAAARKVGDICYGVITTNAALTEDATVLFDASTHANLQASGGVPSVATISAGRTAMAIQTDGAGNTLNVRPSYLLCPVALEDTATTIVAATRDPSVASGESPTPPWIGGLTVVSDPRLDADSSDKWYLFAGSSFPTIEIAFLNGNSSPFLEEVNNSTRDGLSWKVRLDAGASALDFRGVYQNDGVT